MVALAQSRVAPRSSAIAAGGFGDAGGARTGTALSDLVGRPACTTACLNHASRTARAYRECKKAHKHQVLL